MAKKDEEVRILFYKGYDIWLVISVSGFIRIRLSEGLLKLDQNVILLDSFSTECRYNLEDIKHAVSSLR